MFECVQICTVSDTLPAPSTRRRYDLPGVACLVSGADRCSVSSVRAVCRALRGLPCIWHGLPCCLCCSVCPGALGWGLHLWGIWGEPGVGWSTPLVEKIQKRRFSCLPPLFCSKSPTHYCQSQKFPAKTKRPLQRVCVLCYTCLTSLEMEESTMNQKNDKNKERREKNEKIAASIWGIIIGTALLVFGVYLMAHGVSNVI